MTDITTELCRLWKIIHRLNGCLNCYTDLQAGSIAQTGPIMIVTLQDWYRLKIGKMSLTILS